MVMVIGIISLIVIANYNTSEKNQSVVYAAQQIEHDIRNMQAMSLTGKKEEGDPDRPCGYGIKFVKSDTLYTLFRELPNNATKSCADSGTRNKKFDGGEELNNGKVDLPRGVSVSDITIVDNGGGSMGGLSSDIFYTVPFADFFVVGSGNMASVKIKISNTAGVTKTINVIKSGEVSVD